MPYNNNPIAPTKEVTGSINLPLARTKKILHTDPELPSVSNNAAFAITVATEQFIAYLVEQTHNVVKAERKPRRNIQYRDVANAVARHDNLEFLSDVVPRTMTVKMHREKMAKEKKEALEGGQGTLGFGGANGEAPLEPQGGEAVAASPVRERSEHAGTDVMDIDTLTSPTVEQPPAGGMTNGSHG